MRTWKFTSFGWNSLLIMFKRIHLRWKISNWSSFQFTVWLKIIDHPPKCLQIGRPLYNDSSWQAWPKSYDFWSTISWVATRRKERSFQDRYCKSLPELRNRTSEKGGNGIMISCGWWAPTRYKQGHMTPLIGVKKKIRKNHVFKAIYRDYTITPFRYNDLLGENHPGG